MNASGAISPSHLRHMAVNHGLVVVLFSGMEVRGWQTEEEQEE